jgi:hypothetical protein
MVMPLMLGRGFDAAKSAVVAFCLGTAFRTFVPAYESTQQQNETNKARSHSEPYSRCMVARGAVRPSPACPNLLS